MSDTTAAVPVAFDQSRVGRFDDDLEDYVTAKGVNMRNTLHPSPFTDLVAKGANCPAYFRGNVTPPEATLTELSGAVLDTVSRGDYKFKSSGRLKTFRGSYWLYTYYHLLNSGQIPQHDPRIVRALQGKAGKSDSGVTVNTITLSPFPNGRSAGDGDRLNGFSCKFNCHFCPNQPGVPRSYLAEEPAVLRGIASRYHPLAQTFDRLSALFFMGHPVDKVEVKFIGGTWNSFPLKYRKWVVWQTFLAHNLFYTAHGMPLDLRDFDPDRFTDQQLDHLICEAQAVNTSSKCRVIGLTIETRPDCLDSEELVTMRNFGCTRLEIGVQHTSDDILRLINRGHLLQHTRDAIKRAKHHGFKTVIHLMPQLPGSSPEIDREMIMQVIRDPDLQADEWKLYNCEVTPYTEIYKWYQEGSYRPYSDTALLDVYRDILPHVPEYIRIDRLKRDIPATYTVAGVQDGGFRNVVFEDVGDGCREIRGREIKGGIITSYQLSEYEYQSSGGREWFITVKNQDGRLCGFCRLRLDPPDQRFVIPELERLRTTGGVALIRELHVYGVMTPVSTGNSNSQHRGFGQQLVRRAEQIASSHGYCHMAIIAGIGTRHYYRDKLRYSLSGTYMVKQLQSRYRQWYRVIARVTIPLSLVIGSCAGYYWLRRRSGSRLTLT